MCSEMSKRMISLASKYSLASYNSLIPYKIEIDIQIVL